MKAWLLTPVLLVAALSFQSCDLSSGLLSSGSHPKLSFSSSQIDDTKQSVTSPPPENNLKPCGSSLAPGESCALQVQFTPSVAGPRSGTVQIRSNGEVLEEVAVAGQGE